MRQIRMKSGRVVFLDDADYEQLKGRAVYEAGRYPAVSVAGKNIRLHRYLMQPPLGMEVDHINGNPMDNRRENLRVCTHQENLHNSAVRTGKRVEYKGVTYDERKAKPYHASIKIAGRHLSLGYHRRAEEAAQAYNEAAREYHGEFARLNALPEHYYL